MSPFSFVDLFAGIGGFHAVLGAALGGECRMASDVDVDARRVYVRNWPGTGRLVGDLVPLTDGVMAVPEHDVVAAGFPCQPFSKSGHQRGIAETRGTLFFNIARVLQERRPAVVLLENVRNLAGPRHRDTWAMIVRQLRDLGYATSDAPVVFSPHLLPPERGGRPQVRDRVFVVGVQTGSAERAWALRTEAPVVVRGPVDGWDPADWDVAKHLPLQEEAEVDARYALTPAEVLWVDVWQDLLDRLRERQPGARLPGFPLWADEFRSPAVVPARTPPWKAAFLQKNEAFYLEHRPVVDRWLADHDGLAALPPSRRKLEWQAQDAASLWDAVLHLRPSGIRAKRATYLPALVAITQTSVIGQRRRRITPREAIRLQGLPEWFDLSGQADAASYKQLGNGVNVGAAYHVLREHLLHHLPLVAERAPGLAEAVARSGPSPDPALEGYGRAAGGGQMVLDIRDLGVPSGRAV